MVEYSEEDEIIAEKTIALKNDFYQVLGISCHSNPTFQREVHFAYKRLAKLLHPDKNHSPKATKAFQVLQSAFSTLSNPSRRRNYDLGARDDQDASEGEEEGMFDKEEEEMFGRGFIPDLEELLRRATDHARKCREFQNESGHWEEFDDYESFVRFQKSERMKKVYAVLAVQILFACIAVFLNVFV